MLDKQAINEYAVKLSGKAFLPESLVIGKNYHLELEGTVTATTESDNENGSHLFTHRFEPVIVRIVKETGEKINAKDIRSKSQQQRAALYRRWREEGEVVEFDSYYTAKMNHIIGRIIEGEL